MYMDLNKITFRISEKLRQIKKRQLTIDVKPFFGHRNGAAGKSFL